MSRYKDNARLALSRGYWVDGAGVPQGPRGPLKCHDTSTGFPRFSINTPCGRSHVLVHQLAALVLFGEEGLSDEHVILHLDRNKKNNAQDNLALGSRSDGMHLLPRCERILYASNAASRLRSLSTAEVTELRAMRAGGATLRELAERFGIARSTASYIVNRRTYA